MITRDDLAAAVDDGLLTEMQATGLIARAEVRTGAVDGDDERFRFLNGFNDVFLALGITLIAAAFATFMFAAGTSRPAVAATAAVVMWGLAEIVIRRYRAVLPAIFISVAITLFAGLLFGEILSPVGEVRKPVELLSSGSLTAALVLLGFVLVFYWRFRLPFTVGTIGGLGYSCTLLIFTQLTGVETTVFWWQLLTLASGLVIFSVAVAYDFSDPSRLTRRSDCAFWLHMVAAPMITHGLLAPFAARIDAVAVIVILSGFILLGIVSLALDRRVPLVSVLLYLGISIGYLFASVTVQAAITVGATLLLLGAIVVTMGLAWRRLRRALLGPLGRFAFSRKLPPLRPA